MKKTIAQKLREKKYKKPNKFLYWVLCNIVVKSLAKKYGTTFKRNVDMKKYNKQQFILIGNHASRADYIFASLAVGSTRPLNYVIGHNELYRSHLKLILSIANAIPKKNFVPDMTAMRGIKEVLSSGGNICIFPEGMSSISGAQQPIALGSGKFIKHYNLPVLMIKIKGGYHTNPKFNMIERPGKVEVELDELFTVDQIKSLTAEQIQAIIDQKLKHDEYEWNNLKGYEYDCNGAPASQIEQLLYKCPVCNEEYCMEGKANKITCTHCGLEIKINNKLQFTLPSNSYLPATPTKWFEWERRLVRKEVSSENFCIKERVKLGILPKYDYLKNYQTSAFAGEGILSLTKEGLTFEGKKCGQPFSLFIESKNLPSFGMCTDATTIYTFAQDGEYYEFTPIDKNTSIKLMLAAEEIHRVNGGKWQNYSDFNYDDLNAGFIKTN